MRTAVLGFVLVLLLGLAPRAEAVSIRDIIELSKAGLGDEILVALIEADGTIFSLDAGQVVSLKEAGVSERVIVAMLRSGGEAARALRAEERARLATEPARPAEQAPAVVVIGAPAPEILPVPVPYPVVQYVPIFPRRPVAPPVSIAETPHRPGRFINHGFIRRDAYQPPAREAKPVYWGFDGKRRPDTWAAPPGSPEP